MVGPSLSFLSLILLVVAVSAKLGEEIIAQKIRLPTEKLEDDENTDSYDEGRRELQTNEWRFQVDCTADFLISGDSSPGATDDSITAIFYNTLGEVVATTIQTGVAPCTDGAFESWTITSSQDIEGVTLRTNGDDALFVERARLLFCDPGCLIVDEWLNGNSETGVCLSIIDEVGNASGDFVRPSREDNIIGDRCFSQFCFRDGFTVMEGDCANQISSPETVTSQQFGFDCFVPNLANLQTRFNIAVHFRDIDENVIESRILPSGFNPCVDDDDFVIEINTDVRVRSVRMVATNTDPDDVKFDALFIDWAWLDVNGVRVNTWDLDGILGYCLSTEVNDVDNSGWENNVRESTCSSSICFDADNVIDTGCARGNEVNVNVDGQRFVIDCFNSEGSELGTVNDVTFQFFDSDGDLIGTAIAEDGIDCTADDPLFSVGFRDNFDRVVTIEMEISGNDALFIDNAWLEIEGVRVRVYDESGTVGWCLSTDQDDPVADDWLLYTGEDGCASRLCFGRDVVRSRDDCSSTSR